MTITDYRNFDLLITRAGDRYRAFVVDAPEGEASVVFDLPFTPDEMPRLGGSGVVRGVSRQIGAVDDAGSVTSLTDVGSRLFEAIFHDKVQTLLAASLSGVAKEGTGLRLRLRFEEDAAELAALPWETLYDPTLAHFIGLGEQSPIVRYLSLPRSRSALLVEPPLRVLAVLASPAGLPPLDMEREWQVIQDALAGLTADGKFVLERQTTPSLSALQERLLGEPVHILHFVGHGVFDESSQVGSLALEDARGRAQLVQGEQLAALLRNHTAMRLAYLNACEGALASGRSVFTGVAQTLVQQAVPAAVAMQAEISDTSAIELARTFYTALAGGRPVDAALTQARVALSVAGSQEWAIPVLFSRSPDNRLFDIREVLPTPDCPYPGMTPFSEAQQAFFFGRDKEIGEAVERLRQHPFLTVVGPSGSGKSSLIYAGVIPALRKSKRFGPGEWSVQIMRPGQHPMAALAEKLGCSPATLSSVAITERTLLFIDQFEETFTLAEAGEAQTFLEALQGLIGRPNLFILLTARADFYPELMASSLWQPIRANRLELTPLGDDELWAAIVEPAARVGVTVNEALAVQLIADAAGQSGVLPLVQETLVLLWERVERRQLGLAAYRQMAEGGRSGLQVAIDRRASVVYENLPENSQAIARRIFLRLIQFGEGRADTRRQQTVAELRASGDDPALFDQTLATLTDSRLLTASGDAEGGARRVDIAHEALIGGWPRLQEWLNQRRTAEQTRRRLEVKAAEWMAAEKRGGLLDDYELQEAGIWLAGEDARELGYSQDLVELVDASKIALGEVQAKEAEAERSRQRSRVFAGGLALAMLVIALVGYFAWTAQTARNAAETAKGTAETAATAEATARIRAEAEAKKAATKEAEALVAKATAEASQAEAEAARAEVERLTRGIRADQLTANALKVADEDSALALLLAVEGLRAQSDFTETVIVTETIDPQSTGPMTHTVVVSETVVTSALANVHELLFRPIGVHVLDDFGGFDSAAAFGPNGQWLATVGNDYPSGESRASLWDTRAWDADSTVAALPITVGRSAFGVEFSQDGNWLAIGTADGGILLWDVRALTLSPDAAPTVIKGDGGTVYVMAFSADSRWLATGSDDNIVRLWDLSNTNANPIMLQGVEYDVNRIVFSPDGRWLAAASSYLYDAVLWNMVNLNPDAKPIVLKGHNDYVQSLAFSPDGRWLATGSDDKTARLWDLTAVDPAQNSVLRQGHQGGVRAVAFSSNGRWLATVSNDKTARLWDATNLSSDSIILIGHKDLVIAVAFSPDGRWLATGSADDNVRLWNLTAPDIGNSVSILSGHTGGIVSLEFSPDGRRLATAAHDGTVRLWSVINADPIVLVGPQDMNIEKIEFSADGSMLSAGPRHMNTALWNLREVSEKTDNALYGDFGNEFVDAVAYNSDGSLLATAYGGMVWLWDIGTRGPANLVGAKNISGVRELIFSPDGGLLAIGSVSGSWLWNLSISDKDAEPVRLSGEFTDGSVISMAFDSSGNWLVASSSGTAYLWDMDVLSRDGGALPIRLYDKQVDTFVDLAFSPDGNWLVTAFVRSAGLWNMHALRENPDAGPSILRDYLQDYDGQFVFEVVKDLAFSPDSRWLAIADRRFVYVWDEQDFQLDTGSMSTMSFYTDGETNSVAFSPDGTWLAVGSAYKNTRVWNMTAPDELIALPDDQAVVTAVAFSPDGRWLATASDDNTARLWTWSVGDLTDLACRAAGRNLTVEEWRRFMGQATYRSTCPHWPAGT